MNMQYSGPDRRKFNRLKVSFIVIYRVHKPLEVIMIVGNKEINAIMLDLSEGGMALSTNYNIPLATIILIKFTLINPYAIGDERICTLEMTGEVRNNVLAGKNDYRLGICFTDITKENRQIIAHFVKTTANR